MRRICRAQRALAQSATLVTRNTREFSLDMQFRFRFPPGCPLFFYPYMATIFYL